MIGAMITGPYIAFERNAPRQWNRNTWAPTTRKAAETSSR
jgi:hypothetical protein